MAYRPGLVSGVSGAYGRVVRTTFDTMAEAAEAENEEVVLRMLEEGAEVDGVDTNGNTALHWACWFLMPRALDALLARGASPILRNNAGETPVHWAAKSANLSALRLLTKGDHSMLSLRDVDGFTPFLILAQNDSPPLMEWLYLQGLSVEEQDNWGRTSLHWACYKGHRRTVQWLLSRSANIAHRDNDGMTPMHWAAHQGHEPVSEMLMSVGAVHLLSVPDAAGDTPIDIACQKKNRYMVVMYHKCQLFQYLFGRPHIFKNQYAFLFVAFAAVNVFVFTWIIAPGIINNNPRMVLTWVLLMASSLGLWGYLSYSDPGWMAEQTILPQERLEAKMFAPFNAEQPVESQMVLVEDCEEDLEAGSAVHLEMQQSKYNFQRQLLTAAREKLQDAVAAPSTKKEGRFLPPWAEAEPLMESGHGPTLLLQRQQEQLDSASFELKRRYKVAGEVLGRERVNTLMTQGCGEYIELLEKGKFKQVCVVCRTKKEPRSHHCKDCGRCVSRLDHHCPWIDNCVGLGNQRTFYLFVVVLMATLLAFYTSAVLFVFDAIIPAWTSGEAFRIITHVSEWSLGPELRPLVVLGLCVVNLVWLIFVGALVARHTAYILVNITTFEALSRPLYVSRRFPRANGQFWFLKGLEPVRAFWRCLGYWTLDMSEDAEDFPALYETSWRDEEPVPGAVSARRRPQGSNAMWCDGEAEETSALAPAEP